MKLSGKFPRVVVILAVVIPAAAGAIAASGWFFPSPPDPQSASREEILRWLVQGDVAGQSKGMQVALVDRLEEELDLESVASAEKLTESQRKNLEQNITALKHVWFADRVQRYAQLQAEERRDYMNVCVKTVTAWSAVEDALSSDTTNSAAYEFFHEIEQWIAAEPDAGLQQKMWTCVYDGVFRWLATESLEDLSFSDRTHLALGIAAQFKTGMSIGDWKLANTGEEEQLRANSELLMEAWVRRHAMWYAALEAKDRPAYVAEQIDSLAQSNVIELLSGGGEDQKAMLQLLALCEKWVSAAPPQEQSQMRQLLSAVQIELLRRKLQSRI